MDPHYETLFDAAAALLLKRPDPELLSQASLLFGRVELTAEGALAVEDWNELFFVPCSGRYLPPFEATFREKRLGGPTQSDVLAAYNAAGFQPETLDMDPLWRSSAAADHLGLELAFVSALLRNARACPATCRELMDSAAFFHARHVAPWAGDYGQALARSSRSRLYLELGRLLDGLGRWHP